MKLPVGPWQLATVAELVLEHIRRREIKSSEADERAKAGYLCERRRKWAEWTI